MGKTAETDGTIIEFLNGSHSYDGVWFGDKHRTKEGVYWWRKILRDYVEASQFKQPVPDVSKLDFYGWSEKGMVENPKDVLNEDVFILREEAIQLIEQYIQENNVPTPPSKYPLLTN